MPKKIKVRETEEGTTLYSIDPIIMLWHYEVNYVHSYAQDSPFFTALSKGKLLGSACTHCPATFATPRGHCMNCGKKTQWREIPAEGVIHTFTTCYFGGEAFLEETPYTLILVAFKGFDTLLLSRLIGIEEEQARIGMAVRAQFLRNSKFLATDVYFVPSV